MRKIKMESRTIKYLTCIFTVTLAVLTIIKAGVLFVQPPSTALTMLQAIDQARSLAQKWSPKSGLVCVVSSGPAASQLLPSALLKSPRTWNVIFFDPMTKKNLVIHVGGHSVVAKEAFLPYTEVIEESKLKLDSQEAKALVVAHRDLPSDTIFHFLLLKDEVPTLYVFYYHLNRRHLVVMDATRGAILSESP